MPQFEVVDRPNGVDVEDEEMQAIIATKDQPDKAVNVSVEGRNFTNWQSTVRNRLKKHGLKLRAKLNKATKVATVWVEPLDDQK